MSVSNNWEKNPNGENYRPRLHNRPERSSIQQRVDSDILPHFKEKLKRELAGKAPPPTPELTTQIQTEYEGVPQTQNLEPQIEWYTKSAEQGFAPAQYNLGTMYNKGLGVTQDYKQAIEWYTKSAEQGYADAQLNLGFMYKYGEGVTQDYVVAYAWYSVAGANGSELGAEFRDEILKLMTPSQIEKGQLLAQELFEKYGK